MNGFQWIWKRNRTSVVSLLAALGLGVTAISVARRRKPAVISMWQRMLRPFQRAFR